MKIYSYFFYIHRESIAGIVKAESEDEAKEMVYTLYKRFYENDAAYFYESIEINDTHIESEGICEVCYGGNL